MTDQLTLFSGPSPSRRRGQSEGGEVTGGAVCRRCGKAQDRYAGTSSKLCRSCHAEGKRLGSAGSRCGDPVDVTYLTNRPVDPRYDHVWVWGRPSKALPPYEPQLKGRRCRVVCRARPRYGPLLLRGNASLIEILLPRPANVTGSGSAPANIAVEFPNGELVCAPRWAVRRAT